MIIDHEMLCLHGFTNFQEVTAMLLHKMLWKSQHLWTIENFVNIYKL